MVAPSECLAGHLFTSVVRAAAQPGVAPQAVPTTPPNATETAIGLPYRLVLSPNELAAWTNTIRPVTHGGRTELWHTCLKARGTSHAGTAIVEGRQPLRARAADMKDGRPI